MHFIHSVIALAIASLTSALPTTPAPRANTANIIRPVVTSQYSVWTGAIQRNTEYGKIFKNGRTTDITTLLTFEFPEASRGKTCTIHFDLSADPNAKVSGTGQLDVFFSIAPPGSSTGTWPSGNLRNHHIGRMKANTKGEAEWLSGFPTDGQATFCPGGETHAGEFVGVGDVDQIEWLASKQVVYITWQ